MADKTEKKTTSQKLNSLLEKNRKVLIAIFAIAFVALIAFVVWNIVSSKAAAKNIGEIETISYELTNKSLSLDDAELSQRLTTAKEKLEPYSKKMGITGVRANMLLAEISYSEKDYSKAIEYWTKAISKGKHSYTAPLAHYQIAVCYEQTKDLAKAAENYKIAADSKGFALASHALFNYARILESQNNYAEAVEAYQELAATYASDEWANLAKTRVLDLQIQGKAE